MKKHYLVDTNLKCTCCGNVAVIQRGKSLKMEEGHIKHLYCFICKETTAHEESKYGVFGEFKID